MSFASSFRWLAAAGALGAALASAAPASAQLRLIVTEPEIPLVLNSVMWLADQMGYYERAGVDVEIVRVTDTPTAVTALLAGEGDMANIAVPAAVAIAAQNLADIRAVTSPDKFLPFSIVTDNSIRSPADFAGKTYGIAAVGSLDHNLSLLVLQAIGVDPATVTFVPIGPPAQRGAALIAGQINATTMSIGTYLGLPDKTNIHVQVPVDEFLANAGVLNKVNVVRREYLETNRDDVVAFVTAITQAARDFAANPQLWIDAMVIARPEYARENLVILAEQFRGAWSVNAGMDAETIQAAVDAAYGTADLAGMRVVTLPEWVDFTVADEVIAALGGVDTTGDPAGR
jgi:NitT/TauT family transport system substrate-binding protein